MARLEMCPLDGLPWFVPKSSLDILVKEETVRNILVGGRLVPLDRVEETAQEILQHARNLFAVLVDQDKIRYISGFLEEGIGDKDLPFIRQMNKGAQKLMLETSHHRHIKTLENWDQGSLRILETEQYRMLAPVLHFRGHHEFTEFQTLPYVSLDAENQRGCTAEGGYAEVFQARIHPDHHDFWERPTDEDKGPLVAIKRLYSSHKSSFITERRFHEALGATNCHSHLINLLCTYRKGEKYHLVFPWADGTLREYWRRSPAPSFSSQTLLWSFKQMVGIASGLSLIHEFSVPADSPDSTLFGRHGDIKADNILWFSTFQGCDDPDGILQIADMGLASIHRRGSRSNVNPATVIVPSTYSPPDAFRGRRISRAWDVWSLGCMYLEFVTWILCGYEAIEEFSSLRGSEDEDPEFEFSSDCFYTADFNGIRLSVFEWVDFLRNHDHSSAAIHHLLDLIMEEMIVLEPQRRSRSQRILQRLSEIYNHVQDNPEYLLQPVSDGQPLLE
ncbi:hypothetical protein EYZ11_007508 [Aspergillus tanneri]|nr:hypothetical protein EYZ11_007508 [Aspergillus tanneri]